MKYIGLSLSNCVKDILDGKIRLADVMFIITGTYINSKMNMMHVVDIYRSTYWKNYSTFQVMEIIEALCFSGKIIQPRLLNQPTCNIAKGHWVEYNEDKTFDFLESIASAPRINSPF